MARKADGGYRDTQPSETGEAVGKWGSEAALPINLKVRVWSMSSQKGKPEVCVKSDSIGNKRGL